MSIGKTGKVECVSKIIFGDKKVKDLFQWETDYGVMLGYEMYNGTSVDVDYSAYGESSFEAKPGDYFIMSTRCFSDDVINKEPWVRLLNPKFKLEFAPDNIYAYLVGAKDRVVTTMDNRGMYIIKDRRLYDQLGRNIAHAMKMFDGTEHSRSMRFRIIAKHMKGSKVIGYLLEHTSGNKEYVERDQVIRLALGGQLTNCKAYSDGKAGYRLRGVGCNLGDLQKLR